MGARPAIQVVPNQTETTHRKHHGWSQIRVTNRSQIKLTHSIGLGKKSEQSLEEWVLRERVATRIPENRGRSSGGLTECFASNTCEAVL